MALRSSRLSAPLTEPGQGEARQAADQGFDPDSGLVELRDDGDAEHGADVRGSSGDPSLNALARSAPRSALHAHPRFSGFARDNA
jgi:hypothetical protein